MACVCRCALKRPRAFESLLFCQEHNYISQGNAFIGPKINAGGHLLAAHDLTIFFNHTVQLEPHEMY